MATSLKNKVFSSMKWNTCAVIVNMIIQILRISVLARFLDREDFGMIAIALMVVSFSEIFVDLGFTVPLISTQNITKRAYSSVFWVNNILSIVIFVTILISAPYIAIFYNTSSLTSVIQAIGVTVILNALGKIFQTIKQKELQYRFISIVSIISCVTGFICMVIFAILGYGIWSLVWGTIIQTLIRQGVYFIWGLKSNTIELYLSLKEIKDFIRIGSYQVGSLIMDFIASKVDIILLGKLVGMNDLGTYNLAKELIMKCYGLSGSLTRGVMSAAMAKLQGNMEQLRNTFIRYTYLNALAFVPIFAIMFLFSDYISMIMYGDKWETIYWVLSMLSIYGAFSVVVSPSTTVLISTGRTDLSLKWTIVQFIINSTVIVLASNWGFRWIVLSQIPVSIIFVFLTWYLLLRKSIGIRILPFLKSTLKPIIYCAIFAAIIIYFKQFHHDTILTNIIFAFIFISLYLITVIINNKSLLYRICHIQTITNSK